MDDSKVFMFPDAARTSAIDPGLLALINNNGGFGGNGNWIWILFLWMMWGFNGNNGFGNNNGTGFLSNQLNDNARRDLLLQAINGRADAANQLANITNTSLETVKTALYGIQSAISTTGLQTINALQLGDASLSRQLCECCCENKLAICQQTNTLSSQAAANFAAMQLEMAKNEGADQLAVCQQTNTLATQSERNTNSILNAIAGQNTMITKEFCDLKERELQNKINTQGDIITQLRNQISNDYQTLAFNKAMSALDDKIDAIAAKQPNTVPVVWPNLTAVNTTPYAGGCYGYGLNNGFGGSIVF
jgi:hypothetical protein